jgi:hypothetical protein
MQKGIGQKDEANNAQDQKGSLGIGGQPSGGQ